MNNSILGMNILNDLSIDMHYNIADLSIYVNEERLTDFPDKKTYSHWNDGIEIVRIISGAMKIIIKDIEYYLNTGEICVISAGCIHYFESYNDMDCEYYCFIAEESIFSQNDSLINKYLNPLFHSINPTINIIHSESDNIVALIDILNRIILHSEQKYPGYDLYIVGLFNIFIAILYEKCPISFHGGININAKPDKSMKMMITYIHHNYFHDISSEDLCSAGHVSRSKCFSLFRQYTGDTPANFVLKFRLITARNMLARTDMPIAQIAINCGFTHQSHLTSHFTKSYGITPLHYRRNHRES